MTGIDYVVEQSDEGLEMSMTTQGQTFSIRLEPLGGDTFLMDGPPGTGGDLAFSGDDGQGRAAWLVAPVFPAARQPDA